VELGLNKGGAQVKYFYVMLCMLGVLLPYGIFIPWVVENGIDIGLLISEASSTRIGAFAWADVLVSAVALVGFILTEGRRQKIKMLWLPIVATCTVGVSLGLPLFLLQRELHIEKKKH
jgi:hypothetical protein